uniref:Calponin-homology (CH) domain-containing protein n=1 Tax=Arcella intermedia TaxID=1963864 RepID=A0A6B2L1E5_9EUKA
MITLVEILSGKKITEKWSQNPKLKVHKITNCFLALKFLQDECKLQNITISAEDIVNADRMNLVLGFCWLLLRNFQAPPSEEGSSGNEKDKANAFEANLLKWCQDTLGGYKDIDLKDGFKSEAFHNGKALLGLIAEYDKSALDYSKYKASEKLQNCTEALKLGESVVGVPGDLIEAAELAEGKVSDSNMVLYLSLLYNAYKEKYQGQTKDSILKRIAELEAKLKALIIENEELKSIRVNVESTVKELGSKIEVLTEEKTVLMSSKEEVETNLTNLKETFSKEKTDLDETIAELEENISLLKSSSGENQTHLESAKEEAKKERDLIKEELQKTKDKLNKEKEDLQAEQEDLVKNVRRAQKAREELEEAMKNRQQEQGKAIHDLRKHLLDHVRNLHVWKIFLEQDREYESEDLHLVMEPELESLSFAEQISTLATAIDEEDVKLDALLVERKEEDAKKKAAAPAKVVVTTAEAAKKDVIPLDEKKKEKVQKKKAAKK